MVQESIPSRCIFSYLLLLLSRFSRVRLCATPQKAAPQAPPSLGFSRQEHWSGLPFPSPMHKSEKWKWSRSVLSNSSRPHGLQPTKLCHPWDFPGKSTAVGCHCLLHFSYLELHYCNHSSYIELYIWSTASSLVIIFIGGSVTHLVIQYESCETKYKWYTGIKSKYFSHEPPTPFFLRWSRLWNWSLKAEISFFMWFKYVTLKDLPGMKIWHSDWIIAQISPWDAVRCQGPCSCLAMPFSS